MKSNGADVAYLKQWQQQNNHWYNVVAMDLEQIENLYTEKKKIQWNALRIFNFLHFYLTESLSIGTTIPII